MGCQSAKATIYTISDHTYQFDKDYTATFTNAKSDMQTNKTHQNLKDQRKSTKKSNKTNSTYFKYNSFQEDNEVLSQKGQQTSKQRIGLMDSKKKASHNEHSKIVSKQKNRDNSQKSIGNMNDQSTHHFNNFPTLINQHTPITPKDKQEQTIFKYNKLDVQNQKTRQQILQSQLQTNGQKYQTNQKFLTDKHEKPIKPARKFKILQNISVSASRDQIFSQSSFQCSQEDEDNQFKQRFKNSNDKSQSKLAKKQNYHNLRQQIYDHNPDDIHTGNEQNNKNYNIFQKIHQNANQREREDIQNQINSNFKQKQRIQLQLSKRVSPRKTENNIINKNYQENNIIRKIYNKAEIQYQQNDSQSDSEINKTFQNRSLKPNLKLEKINITSKMQQSFVPNQGMNRTQCCSPVDKNYKINEFTYNKCAQKPCPELKHKSNNSRQESFLRSNNFSNTAPSSPSRNGNCKNTVIFRKKFDATKEQQFIAQNFIKAKIKKNKILFTSPKTKIVQEEQMEFQGQTILNQSNLPTQEYSIYLEKSIVSTEENKFEDFIEKELGLKQVQKDLLEKIDIPLRASPQKQSSLNLPLIGKDDPIRTDTKTSNYKVSTGKNGSKYATNKSLTMKQNSSFKSLVEGTQRQNSNILPKINIFEDPLESLQLQLQDSNFIFPDRQFGLSPSRTQNSYSFYLRQFDAPFESQQKPLITINSQENYKEQLKKHESYQLSNQSVSLHTTQPNNLNKSLQVTGEKINMRGSKHSESNNHKSSFLHLNSLNTLHPMRNSSHSDMIKQSLNKRVRKRAYSENKDLLCKSEKSQLKHIHKSIKKVNESIKSSISYKDQNIGFFDKPQNNLQELALKIRKNATQRPKESNLTINLVAYNGQGSLLGKNQQEASELKTYSFGMPKINSQSVMSQSMNFANTTSQAMLGSIVSLPKQKPHSNRNRQGVQNRQGHSKFKGSNKSRLKPRVRETSQFKSLDKKSQHTIRESDSDYDDQVQKSLISSDLNFSNEFASKTYSQIALNESPMKIVIINQATQKLDEIEYQNNAQTQHHHLLSASHFSSQNFQNFDSQIQGQGKSMIDSIMLKSVNGQSYTQYSGKLSNQLNTSQNASQVDSRYANYSSQQENIGQFDEPINFVSESDGSVSAFEEQSPNKNANMINGQGGQYLETQHLSNQYSIKKHGQHSSASVVYNYLKGTSSDILSRTYISGSISRRATSNLRIVRFKPSDKSILSKGSSKDLDPFIKRLMHQEDDEYWNKKQTKLVVVRSRVSAADQQFKFPDQN